MDCYCFNIDKGIPADNLKHNISVTCLKLQEFTENILENNIQTNTQ